jgi:hypothetical protein
MHKNHIQVLNGLNGKDSVAANAQYLMDSESLLRSNNKLCEAIKIFIYPAIVTCSTSVASHFSTFCSLFSNHDDTDTICVSCKTKKPRRR